MNSVSISSAATSPNRNLPLQPSEFHETIKNFSGSFDRKQYTPHVHFPNSSALNLRVIEENTTRSRRSTQATQASSGVIASAEPCLATKKQNLTRILNELLQKLGNIDAWEDFTPEQKEILKISSTPARNIVLETRQELKNKTTDLEIEQLLTKFVRRFSEEHPLIEESLNRPSQEFRGSSLSTTLEVKIILSINLFLNRELKKLPTAERSILFSEENKRACSNKIDELIGVIEKAQKLNPAGVSPKIIQAFRSLCEKFKNKLTQLNQKIQTSPSNQEVYNALNKCSEKINEELSKFYLSLKMSNDGENFLNNLMKTIRSQIAYGLPPSPSCAS